MLWHFWFDIVSSLTHLQRLCNPVLYIMPGSGKVTAIACLCWVRAPDNRYKSYQKILSYFPCWDCTEKTWWLQLIYLCNNYAPIFKLRTNVRLLVASFHLQVCSHQTYSLNCFVPLTKSKQCKAINTFIYAIHKM